MADGERVLNVGTGTGKIMELAAPQVGLNGHVLGVDLSPEMLAYAQTQLTTNGLNNVSLREGGAEAIPADENSSDVVLTSLSFMYVVDRAAAGEFARVLRRGGRLGRLSMDRTGTVRSGPLSKNRRKLCGSPTGSRRRPRRPGGPSLISPTTSGSWNRRARGDRDTGL